MTSFDERLKKAVQRGKQRGEEKARDEIARATTEEEYKRLHSGYQLQLSDHIEQCIKRLADHFPGFRFETVYGERGWGAAGYRDDFDPNASRRSGLYSRLEMTVRPYSSLHVLELTAKGAIRNKEIFNRKHFKELEEVDIDHFTHLIDTWVLEYAELFAAS